MIRFSSLVEAIQGAVNQAADAVSRENIKSLLEYFQPVEQSDSESDGGRSLGEHFRFRKDDAAHGSSSISKDDRKWPH